MGNLIFCRNKICCVKTTFLKKNVDHKGLIIFVASTFYWFYMFCDQASKLFLIIFF